MPGMALAGHTAGFGAGEAPALPAPRVVYGRRDPGSTKADVSQAGL